MAQNTDPQLRQQVIYSVFVRNHTKEGTFLSLIPDLERIHKLGCDIVWLMPIHPTGVKGRKGTLGSPYANRDYRAVNPEFGTLEDFRQLVDAIHAQGMKCIIDVVYNHTSPDSVLFEQHPEFFYHKPDGQPGNHVGDWSDVIDLDYGTPGHWNRPLWDYQIQTLCYWAQFVDGFRCDVASFVPVEFWEEARAAVAKVRPGAIWLAETVHRSFAQACRALGMNCARDTEAFQAFDIEYSYDIQETFDDYLRGKATLSHYLDLVDFQDAVYPANYDKMRYLENHDLPRIASWDSNPRDLRNLLSLMYFLKGTTLLYAGQEVGCDHTPSLFDRDPVDWDGRWDGPLDQSSLMCTLYGINRDVLRPDDYYHAKADDEKNVAVLYRDHLSGAEADAARTLGVFSLKGVACEVEVDAPDGTYANLIDGRDVTVSGGKLSTDGEPIILSCPRPKLAV
ncbi:MAG: alpha-amylase family glycosyl hydrolase [Olsenella sp.]|jgi:glycosidase|nr:alpha-amylase family glycosyl hydrolase [Olsenella sp.]MCI1288623.1 alpha-amylase family glycosyl hydrolase [Olsenella sp.]